MTTAQNLANLSQVFTNSPLSHRNRFINGCMRVAQRGTSVSVSSGTVTYGAADRWYVYSAGAATTSGNTVSSGGLVSTNYMQVSGVSGNTAISIGQKIESTNIADLAGKQVTISGWVYTPTTTVPSIVLYYPNSKDNFSSNTVILGAPSLSSIVASTWTYVSFTTTLPTQVTNGLQVEFSFGAATSGVVAMTGMQLESGPVATPFEIRTYGYELALCQRYYQTIDAISFWGMGASGAAFGGTTTIQVMRATPTTVVGNWTYGAAAGGVISATTQRVSIYAIANSAVGVSTSANNVTLTAEL